MKNKIKVFDENRVYDFDDNSAFLQFSQHYTRIFAAGGLVFNDKKEILMIYRFGKWDFPKGKIENGESAIDAAMREVAEETGVANFTNCQPFSSTFHIYSMDNQRILKETTWFIMQGGTLCKLTPQLEENITAVQWTPVESLHDFLKDSYPSLQHLASKLQSQFIAK